MTTPRLRALVAALVLGLVTLWVARGMLLRGVGDLLVAEDALEPTEIVVMSGSAPGLTSLEGVDVFRAALARRLLIVEWRDDEVGHRLEQLGIQQLSAAELIQAVLDKSEVPTAVVTVLPAKVDGTESEIRAVARYVEEQQVASVLYITLRTHTARARYLFGQYTRGSARVLVRASRVDPFTSVGWWRDREQARDVMAEYLRWLNSLILGAPSPEGAPGASQPDGRVVGYSMFPDQCGQGTISLAGRTG